MRAIFILLIFLPSLSFAKTVEYSFDIIEKTVNFSGNEANALTIDNKIPGPLIEATVGDILQVTFNNKLEEETSIHWHGVLLPNEQDGVPYLTTPSIKPGTKFTYKYKITHPGTYWYHSHSGLQEQRGLYGALVFHPKKEKNFKKDQVVVLSDWTDEHPSDVLANIKKDGHYYALKKDSVQSWWGAINNGFNGISNKINGSWIRMGPMDLSDVGYDAFLTNGKRESYIKASKGDSIRLRIINAAASTYFYIEFAGLPMKIVSADGVDIEPLEVSKLKIAVAETYDIVVKIPDNKTYELRSSAEDGTGYASLYIGKQGSEKIYSNTVTRPNPYTMNHEMHDMDSSDNHDHHKMHGANAHNMMGKGAHKKTIELNNYNELKAIKNTELPKNQTYRLVKLNLTGNMERYVWSFNNKTLLEADTIKIKKGENVKFILQNETMMHHPIHLHGHFFRVLNGQGKRSPLKHTVNVPPMQTVEIEFEANEEKDWFFHCHNLYHMKNGMARIVSYESSTKVDRELINKIAHDNWYFAGDMSLLSNMGSGDFKFLNTRNAFEVEYDHNFKKAYDIEATYSRSFTRFLEIYAGGQFERENKNEKPENLAIVGIKYVLPLLINSNIRVDNNGNFRLGISSDLQLTDRLKFEWSANTNEEYMTSLSYELNKNFLITSTYDSDYNWGVGGRIKF